MTQLLKPGFLVSLKTSLDGGVSYQRKDLTPEEIAASAEADVARWETVRVIEDAAEYTAAKKARGLARSTISAVCTNTSFGLLCPEAREKELDAAIVEAQKIVDTFNATAKASTVRVYVIRGRIASTDEEATRAMASEVRELLEEMQSGIRRVDVEAIREAASKAKRIGAILDPEQGKKVAAAVEAARDAAKMIVKRIEVEGEAAVKEVAASLAGPIESARFSFLELEESIQKETAAPVVAAALDLEESAPVVQAPPAPAAAIELDDAPPPPPKLVKKPAPFWARKVEVQ